MHGEGSGAEARSAGMAQVEAIVTLVLLAGATAGLWYAWRRWLQACPHCGWVVRRVQARRPTASATGLACPREDLVSLGQPIAIRLEALIVRDSDPHALEPLKPVLEHRAVRLAQDIQPKVYHEIRADTEDVAIEGRVVKLAERDSIGHDGLTPRIAVGQDVGGLEQLQVP
jgi:hypothetical protein